MYYDPNHPHYVTLADVQARIGDGWLAQYRGRGIVSTLIQYGTGGLHSHSAMLRRNNGHVDALELREWYGGRAVTLESQVAEYPHRIDLFRPDVVRFPEFEAGGAVEVMRYLTGRKYGYWQIARLTALRVPGLRLLWPLRMSDDLPAEKFSGAPFCSHAVCLATRIGGGVDPCPRKPDDLVTPNDLTWSLFYEYVGTLVP